MKREPVFQGAATALVTPLTPEGIDYEKFAALIEWQISEGIDGLVICGTTGEGSTLTDEEHRAAIAFAVKTAAGRVPIIAGTGSNDTDYAIDLTKFSSDVGADAMLVVTPYYNKATQKGLIKMYQTIADASAKPVILYNVPSRTGVNIEPETYLALADHPQITAVKEANGNFSKIAETMALVGDRLDFYSGNDDQIVPIMSLGGIGVISVLANVAPGQTHEICRKYLDGDVAGSLKEQLRAMELCGALFCEVNPIPVKKALELMGLIDGTLRMPLSEMEPANVKRLENAMKEYGIL